jgi:hypothetical protein
MKIKQIDPTQLLDQLERIPDLEKAFHESLELTLKKNLKFPELLHSIMNEEMAYFIVSDRRRCLQYMKIINPETPKNFRNLIAKMKLQLRVTRHYILSYYETKKYFNDKLYGAG